MRDRRSTVAGLAVIAALGAGPGPGPAAPDPAALDRVLAEVVRGEGVDYELLRDRHLPALAAYLDGAAQVDPRRLAPGERLAFYLNLYNANVLAAVAARLAADYTPARDSFALFDEPRVRAKGERLSLNRLEHEILRKRFDEPRIHAALVCAARSCPPLQSRAYRGEDLDARLDRDMRRFVNDPSRNEIDAAGRRLRLSSIFDWYSADFGGRDALAAYVNRYTEVDTRGFAVEFLPYSWELNRAPR